MKYSSDNFLSKSTICPILLLFLLALNGSVLHSATIRIPYDHPTIQEGIDAASDGDTILIYPGTYYENLSVMDKNLVIGSLFLNTNDTTYVEQTVIDGSGQGVVVYFAHVEEPSMLCGLVVQNGNAQYGGGISLNVCTIRISHVNVINNLTMDSGAGIKCYYTKLELSDFIIKNNRATGEYGINGEGGGIWCYGCQINIYGGMIKSNRADLGGGLLLQNTSGKIFNTTIISNLTGYPGGGIFVSGGHLTIENCSFEENQGAGSAVYAQLTNMTFINSIFTHNDWTVIEAAESNHLNFINCTVAENDTQGYHTFVIYWRSIVYVLNCVFFNEAPKEIYLEGSDTLYVYHSDIDGGINGIGHESYNSIHYDSSNIDTDPLFTAPGDFHLSDYSPCIGSGLDSLAVDMSWLCAPAYDFENNPRPAPVNSNPDIGAFENVLGDPLTGIKVLNPDATESAGLILSVIPTGDAYQIKYSLPDDSFFTLRLYSLSGVRMRNLAQGSHFKGDHLLKWDSHSLPQGMYLITLQNNTGSITEKITIIGR
jgi:hypothetical protein